MQLEYKAMPFEVRATSQDGGEFEGLAAVFHSIDDSYYGDIIAPGAFQQDLPQFLAAGFIGGTNHNWSEPIGRPLLAEEQPAGLMVKGSISDTAHGRDVRTLMRDQVIKSLSIGFRALGRKWLENADEVMAYWQSAGYVPTAEDVAKSAYGARLLTRIRLYEVSPVAVPAAKRAAITAVKGDRAAHTEGLTFEMHSEQVLDAVEEYVARAQSLADRRAEDGRSLAPEKRRQFRRLLTGIEGLLAATERRADADQVARLHNTFLALVARGHGAALD